MSLFVRFLTMQRYSDSTPPPNIFPTFVLIHSDTLPKPRHPLQLPFHSVVPITKKRLPSSEAFFFLFSSLLVPVAAVLGRPFPPFVLVLISFFLSLSRPCMAAPYRFKHFFLPIPVPCAEGT